MNLEKIKKPFNFIIFGASGDLAKLKIFPSLYQLALQNRLPEEFKIYGFSRSKMTDKQFRESFKKSVKTHVQKELYDEKILNKHLKNLHYHCGQYDQLEDYESLVKKLREVHGGKKVHNLAFFSTPPVVLKPIVKNLWSVREELGGKLQLMIEKPFGEDRKSAGELFKYLNNYFEKEDLFLIDHYLGKAAVRSIFPLRYNNAILNLLLKGEVISNIQINALETLGVDERIGFFENVGVIKDMVQSHLLQILAFLTMRMPLHQETHSIQREKGDIISALRLDKEKGLVLGQYRGYRDQEGVASQSQTPTFAALRFFIDLVEWHNTPIYIRTGKSLSHKHTYIVVEFNKPTYAENTDFDANKLIIELYPKEKIEIKLVNDIGKEVHQYTELITEESLACQGDDCLPPHANLILDAFLGRSVSFLSIDEILASWHFIDDVNKCIQKKKDRVKFYDPGSEGPKAQHQLTKIDGNQWYDAGHL